MTEFAVLCLSDMYAIYSHAIQKLPADFSLKVKGSLSEYLYWLAMSLMTARFVSESPLLASHVTHDGPF